MEEWRSCLGPLGGRCHGGEGLSGRVVNLKRRNVKRKRFFFIFLQLNLILAHIDRHKIRSHTSKPGDQSLKFGPDDEKKGIKLIKHIQRASRQISAGPQINSLQTLVGDKSAIFNDIQPKISSRPILNDLQLKVVLQMIGTKIDPIIAARGDAIQMIVIVFLDNERFHRGVLCSQGHFKVLRVEQNPCIQ